MGTLAKLKYYRYLPFVRAKRLNLPFNINVCPENSTSMAVFKFAMVQKDTKIL